MKWWALYLAVGILVWWVGFRRLNRILNDESTGLGGRGDLR